jgi:hypothetical protein
MSRSFPVLTTVALCAAGLAGTPAWPVDVRICSSLDEALPQTTAPALLVFFSTDCPVCYEELLEARFLLDRGGWPVAVVGVTIARRDELQAFLEKYVWTSPVVLDRRKAVFRRYNVHEIPYKVLIAGTETVYRDDPYLGNEARRKELAQCLTRLFSR